MERTVAALLDEQEQDDSGPGQRFRALALRRASDDGEIPPRALTRAREVKYERFRDAEFVNRAPVSPGACNWTSVGPRNINGRIKSLAVHPTNGQVLYAGTADGGVWKTTNGGQSWAPTMHDQDSLAIGAIAIDPNNSETLYAGTGEAVFRGLTTPGGGSIAWWYEGVGVFKSTDGGASWSLPSPIPNDFIYRIAVDPFDSTNLLCAGFSLTDGGAGLCRSTNGGLTWTTVLSGIFTDVLFDPSNPGRAYAGQNNGGVLKSTDSGATWVARNTGLPAVASIQRVSLTLARANTNVLYAKLEDGSGGLHDIFRTASAAEAPGGWAAVGDPGVDSSYVWWCSCIAADPTDASGNIVWAGGVTLARSGNGGATWAALPGPVHADQHAILFDPGNANTVYVANDGGIFRGVFGGGTPPVTWTKISTGLVATQFYDLSGSPASPSVFGGGTQDNGSNISTGGLSWRHVLGGDGGYVQFHPTDPYIFYVQWQNANINRTADGGNSFVSARDGITGSGIFPATVMVIDPNNPNILFAGTNRVFRTTVGGIGVGAWSIASGVIGKVTEITIAPSSSAIIYAGTITGGLHRAGDGGATATSFVDVTPSVAGFPTRWLSGITVHPTDANTIYVTFLGFNGSVTTSDHVWKGVFHPVAETWAWTLRAGGLPDVPVGALVFEPVTSTLYAATDIGVFRSLDDGVNWEPFELGLPNTAIVDLALHPARRTLRAATHGRGMYEINLDREVACPEVDIYLRDNILDTGEFFPSPSGIPDPTQPGVNVAFYKSADIKVDAPPFDPTDALVDGVEFDDPEHTSSIETIAGIRHQQPIRGVVNRVYVQAHNRGWNTAGEVTLKVLYADAGAGLPALPPDFWPAFPTDSFTQTNWKPIGTATLTDLLPNEPQVRVFNWTPPATVSDHVCILAMAHSVDDSLLPQTELVVDNLTRWNKRVTHHNVHPIDAPVPSSSDPSLLTAWTSLYFHNAHPQEARIFDLRIEEISDAPAGLRMILPETKLIDALETSVSGFKIVDLSKAELMDLVSIAKADGAISDYVIDLAASFSEPLIVLDVAPEETRAELRGVLIQAGSKIPAIFVITFPVDAIDTRPLHFEVTQYFRGELVGGSEFVFNPKGIG